MERPVDDLLRNVVLVRLEKQKSSFCKVFHSSRLERERGEWIFLLDLKVN